MLVTVGSAYIRSGEAPTQDILYDMVEMCRGIQHPIRGLFLRNYLSEMTKDKLPDTGNSYERLEREKKGRKGRRKGKEGEKGGGKRGKGGKGGWEGV